MSELEYLNFCKSLPMPPNGKSGDFFINGDYLEKRLFKGNRVVMSNIDEDILSQYSAYKNAFGWVLVGGLGLGLLPRAIAAKENVDEIIIIESEIDVIELCPINEEKIKVFNDDFFKFLTMNDLNIFDYVYTDTYHIEAGVYEDIILPQKTFFSEKYPNLKVDFWAEEKLREIYLKNK